MSAVRQVAEGLDELSATRLAEGRELLADLLAEHEKLASAVRAELPEYPGPAARAYEAWDVEARLGLLPDESARCLLFALAGLLAPGGQDYAPPADWFYWLTRRPLKLAVGDVRLLAVLSVPGSGSRAYEAFEFVVRMTSELLRQGAVGAAPLAEAVADHVLSWNPMVYPPDRADDVLSAQPGERLWDGRSVVADLRDRALALAGRPPAAPALEGPVSRDDAFGLAVIAELGSVETWPPGVRELLELCATAKTARPGVLWARRCRQRLAEVEEPERLLLQLLDLELTTEPVTYLTDQGRRQVLIGFNRQLITGLRWAAELARPPSR